MKLSCCTHPLAAFIPRGRESDARPLGKIFQILGKRSRMTGV